MARPDWLRTFVAIYRAGSVTEGARARHLSQPAASQQLTALERSVGEPVFVRSASGVVPTPRGRELYAAIADPLDRIEGVLAGLDAGSVPLPPRVRVGATAECFAGVLLPRLAVAGVAVDAVFGPDAELIDQLATGELDVAVTSTAPPKRLTGALPIAEKEFKLVSAPALAPPRRIRDLDRLGDWLTGRPWVSYSVELPLTRRFWLDSLGRPFGGDLRLVAPDLRVVGAAVEAGMGMSLLPGFACDAALGSGRLVELFPVGGLIAREPWFLSARPGGTARPDVRAVVAALGG